MSIPVWGESFLNRLMWGNVALVLFNMLPAVPMDGGRVLRALLAQWTDYVRATRIAAFVGQGMAILFGIIGFATGQLLLMLIVLFVYIGAMEESRLVELRSVLKGVRVRDVAQTSCRTLTPDDTLETAAQAFLTGEQQDFPVLAGSQMVGLLTLLAVVKARAQSPSFQTVGDLMEREFLQVDEATPLNDVLSRMQERGYQTAGVTSDEAFFGILTLSHVARWLLMHSAFDEVSQASFPRRLSDGERPSRIGLAGTRPHVNRHDGQTVRT